MTEPDVTVVGGGNAGLSAAIAAAETGARVLVLERAPREWAGGNSYFTAGAFRVPFGGLDELRSLVALTDEELATIEVPAYTREEFLSDMQRVTRRRCDPHLANVLVDDAADAVRWLSRHGVTWRLMFERQSFRIADRIRFWGNLVIGTTGGGQGLIEAELAAAQRCGVELRYGTEVLDLVRDGQRVAGVVYEDPSGRHELRSGAVVLASGGFQGDARARASYLGPGWDLAKVRGTPYNTGGPLFIAIEHGARAAGHWSGCHAIAWDADAPGSGDRQLTNRYSRQAYPFGLSVNQAGRRFIDEGADFRNYTYAKYGRHILDQPDALAFQLFDANTIEYVSRIDYDTAHTSRFEARTIAELAEQIGADAVVLEETVRAFNQAVQPGAFDPTIKDGKRTLGIDPPKSNWAQPLVEPPFIAFAVTCGITFTFGGLSIDTTARVLDTASLPIPGLFACGEIVGGLFYHNYPGGSGLTSGTVFGRRAGTGAGYEARKGDV